MAKIESFGDQLRCMTQQYHNDIEKKDVEFLVGWLRSKLDLKRDALVEAAKKGKKNEELCYIKELSNEDKSNDAKALRLILYTKLIEKFSFCIDGIKFRFSWDYCLMVSTFPVGCFVIAYWE